MRRFTIIVLLLIPVVVSAQEHRFELTPTVGYRSGGTIILEENAYQPGIYEVDCESSAELGLRLGYLMTEALELELMFSRHYSEFEDKRGLFGEVPGGFIPIEATEALDTDVTTWQLGLLWHLKPGPTRPYLLAAAGKSRIDSQTPLPDETAMTYGIGAGVKVAFSDRLGLLLEGRYNWSRTKSDNAGVLTWEHRDCVGTCSYTYRYDDEFAQGSLVAGLIVKF